MTVCVKNHLRGANPDTCAEPSSAGVIDLVSRNCMQCGNCLRECAFLQRHGPPGRIAGEYLAGELSPLTAAFSCSLCRLCSRICPQGLPVAEMFLELRRIAVLKGQGRFRGHLSLLGFEAIGGADLMTCYLVPAGCTTVLFPGCSLPGIRPEQSFQLFLLLQKRIPNLGLVFDCCNKPSHDLGLQEKFLEKFNRKVDRLETRGIKRVITACPSCFQIFRQYGKSLEITTIYSHLAELGVVRQTHSDCRYTLHDPCTVRFEPHIYQAVRRLVRSLGIELTEMEHNCATTLCCGEGGAACCQDGNGDSGWKGKRLAEAGDANLLTYCAGCTSTLASDRTSHLLDLLLPTEERPGKVPKFTKAPFTYLNRLYLKLKMVKHFRNVS